MRELLYDPLIGKFTELVILAPCMSEALEPQCTLSQFLTFAFIVKDTDELGCQGDELHRTIFHPGVAGSIGCRDILWVGEIE